MPPKSLQLNEKLLNEQPSDPAGEKAEAPRTPHGEMQNLLRRVSVEETTSPIRKQLRSVSVESVNDLVEEITRLQHAEDKKTLESVAYSRFPVLAELFGFGTYCFDLTFRSVPWFQFWWWTVQLGFRTCVWATMVLPPLLTYAAAYFTDRRICRRIRVGPTPREFVDIYVPDEASLALQGKGPKVPVVVALMGGGFVVGHRSYNVQLGLRCIDCGVMFVCIDYRNFPFARIPDMVENVSRGVRWVFQNIESFGGDVNNMIFAGQSAGAHLAATLLMEHCLLEAQQKAIGREHLPSNNNAPSFDTWSVKQFKAFFGVSGPYDLVKMSPHIGLPPRVVNWLTMNDPDSCSPGFLVSSEEWHGVAEDAAKLLPPIHLFHGATDMLVPSAASSSFAEQLRAAGVAVTLDIRDGINHTYPVIEGPMLGHDIQMELFLPILFGEGAEKRLERASKPWFVEICSRLIDMKLTELCSSLSSLKCASKLVEVLRSVRPKQPRRLPMWPRPIVSLAAILSPFGRLEKP